MADKSTELSLFREILDDFKTYTNEKYDSFREDIKDDISDLKTDMKSMKIDIESLKEKKGFLPRLKANWMAIVLLFFVGRSSVELLEWVDKAPKNQVEQSLVLSRVKAEPSSTIVVSTNKKLDDMIVNNILKNTIPRN